MVKLWIHAVREIFTSDHANVMIPSKLPRCLALPVNGGGYYHHVDLSIICENTAKNSCEPFTWAKSVSMTAFLALTITRIATVTPSYII